MSPPRHDIALTETQRRFPAGISLHHSFTPAATVAQTQLYSQYIYIYHIGTHKKKNEKKNK